MLNWYNAQSIYDTYHYWPCDVVLACVTSRSKFRCVVLLAVERASASIVLGWQSAVTLRTPMTKTQRYARAKDTKPKQNGINNIFAATKGEKLLSLLSKAYLKQQRCHFPHKACMGSSSSFNGFPQKRQLTPFQEKQDKQGNFNRQVKSYWFNKFSTWHFVRLPNLLCRPPTDCSYIFVILHNSTF